MFALLGLFFIGAILFSVAWGLILWDEHRSRTYFREHPESGERLLAGIKLAFQTDRWNAIPRDQQEALIDAEVHKGPVEGCPADWVHK